MTNNGLCPLIGAGTFFVRDVACHRRDDRNWTNGRFRFGARKSSRPRVSGRVYPDTERSTATGDLEQAINIGVRARTVLCICGVLGENLKTVGRSVCVDGSKDLFKILINRK